MKNIYLLFIFLSLQAFSQKYSEIREQFWGKNDIYKSVTATPEKWNNESAVVIYKNEFYEYDKTMIAMTHVTSRRKRIKLQDAAAVKEYSEFDFKTKIYKSTERSNGYTLAYLGVKIMKPSGKEIEIDVDKDLKTEDNKSKLAISNLEIGDIIDYFYFDMSAIMVGGNFKFRPIESTLGETYPVMDYKLEFVTENDFFINFNNYNGAPELKDVDSGKNRKRKYELSAKNIDKNEFPRWFYPLVELPCYKFQVCYAKNSSAADKTSAFLSDSEKIIKKTVTKEDIFNFYEDKLKPDGKILLERKFLKDQNFQNDEDKIREIYYFARHQYNTRLLQAFALKEANIFNPFYMNLYKSDDFMYDGVQFIKYFMKFLKEIEIDYDIVVATDRANGNIEDLLIETNVTLLLRINTKKPLFIQFFSPHSSADIIDPDIENTKAYVLQVSKGKKVIDVETIILPSTSFKENNSFITSTVSLNKDITSLNVKRTSSFIGHFKEGEQNEKLLFNDYINEDHTKYGTETAIDMLSSKRDREKYTKQYDAYIVGFKEKQNEAIKKSTIGDYNFEIDDHKFEIKTNGRFGSNTPFTYEENFIIKNNLIKKAGENYILEIGKLLTSQIEIDKKEKDRKNNIYLAFPRSFDNEIIFEIPIGYSITGIEKLNKKIENETGLFTSSAVITGSKIIIKTKKQYNNYYEPNKNWSKMIDFLDGAYQFTQEKVLLKKN